MPPMSPSDSEPDDKGSEPNGRMPWAWARMYAVVFEFLAYIGVLGYLGWWLDQRRGWAPWGSLAGLLLGTGMGLYRMIRESKRLGM